MGTHYKGTKEESDALDVFIKLVRAASSVSARVEAHLYEIGLTVSQFGVLESLYHLGPLYQKDLAAKILKSTGNITMVVDNLEKAGLVERVRDENDRRHFFVRITDRGSGLIRSFFPGHVQRIVQEMGRLTRAEQAALGRLCKKVGLGARTAAGKKG
jgi:MarR family 2-MHQ and catechol resistance regulon transcriptional repressor